MHPSGDALSGRAGRRPQPGETRALSRIIRFLRQQHGITVLLIEHDMGMVMEISDHIIVLDHGDVIARGAPQAIEANASVIAAYLGAEEGDAPIASLCLPLMRWMSSTADPGPEAGLTVNEETVALIGANGAGKSTLLMSVFGQPRIAGRRFSIAGRRSAESTRYRRHRPRPRKGGASFPI